MSIKRSFLILALILLTFSLVSIAVAGPEYPIHVPAASQTGIVDYSPDNIRDANDHGCDDWWADFDLIPGYELDQLEVWSYQTANMLHIDQHNGLDGYYSCDYGYCDLHLCTKHSTGGFPFNAWSTYLTVE